MLTRSAVDGWIESFRARGGDLDRELRWQFFFVDHDRSKLQGLVPTLEDRGFRIGWLDSANDDGSHLYLSAEEDAKHSVASIWDRCLQMTELAIHHDVESFDGFDVANVDGAPLF
jgi:hypothetical protein